MTYRKGSARIVPTNGIVGDGPYPPPMVFILLLQAL
jgi:hypothetical protein